MMKKIEIEINTGCLQDDEDLLTTFVNICSFINNGITFEIKTF